MYSEDVYGLIGYPLYHSFSAAYFSKKFAAEGIENVSYVNFELLRIRDLEKILKTSNLKGLNVTIPYKQEVLQYVHQCSNEVKAIGATNCLAINGSYISAFNTDVIGIKRSLQLTESIEKLQKRKALILGTGGASLAVQFVLQQLGIPFNVVSRDKIATGSAFNYEDINQQVIELHTLIINTTPVGTFPSIHQLPSLPYEYLTKKHFLFDLVYNPPLTAFLKKGQEAESIILNGEKMLQLQAEASWEIWSQHRLAPSHR